MKNPTNNEVHEIPEYGSEINIRQARLGDEAGVDIILQQSVRDSKTGEILYDEIADIKDSINESILQNTKKKFYIAEFGGKIIGIMGMTEPDPRVLDLVSTEKPIEIINAFVDTGERGKNVGKMLAKNIEATARNLGFTELIVNSGPRYEHTGWPFWRSLYGEPVSVKEDYYGPGLDAPVWVKILQK